MSKTLSDYTEKIVKAAERLHQCACEFEEPSACADYYQQLEDRIYEMEKFAEPEQREESDETQRIVHGL